MDGSTKDLTSSERFESPTMSRAEPSRAEPSRAEPSRAEPSRAEPSRAEPSRAEPSRAEPSRAEPSRAEPSRAEPSRAEPSRAEPSRAEPSRAEPSRAEPSRAEPSRAEPSRAEPSRAEPSRAEPSRAEPSRAEPSPEAMTTPRPREQRRPPSSSDRRPPRRGGGPLPDTYAASAAGRPAGPARLRVARHSLVGSARALATAAWLAALGALALPTQAQTQTPTCTLNTGDLWCSVITVGEHEGHYGYNKFQNQGELSSDSFMVGMSRYTIDILSVAGSSEENAGDPILDLSERPSAAEQEALDRLVLHLGDDAFRLIDRKAGPPGTFYWEDNDLDWSGEDYVIARLREIPPPEVTLHLSDNEPHEDLLAVTVTATASPASPVAFTVEISASPVAPATDDDFELSTNRVLSFAANATESTGTVRIDPVSDEDPEPHDVVTVSGVVSNPAIPNPDDVTLTILNDDADLPQDIAIDAPAAVDEGAGTANVTVTLTTRQNTAPVIDAQLFYRQRPETATRGDDYTRPQGLGNRIAIVPISAFSANADGTAWVARHSFEIGIVDDGEAEADETIVFEIYIISDNRGTEQTIVIRDDDRPPAVSIAAANPTVLEGQPAVIHPEPHRRHGVGADRDGGADGAGGPRRAAGRGRDGADGDVRARRVDGGAGGRAEGRRIGRAGPGPDRGGAGRGGVHGGRPVVGHRDGGGRR